MLLICIWSVPDLRKCMKQMETVRTATCNFLAASYADQDISSKVFLEYSPCVLRVRYIF